MPGCLLPLQNDMLQGVPTPQNSFLKHCDHYGTPTHSRYGTISNPKIMPQGSLSMKEGSRWHQRGPRTGGIGGMNPKVFMAKNAKHQVAAATNPKCESPIGERDK